MKSSYRTVLVNGSAVDILPHESILSVTDKKPVLPKKLPDANTEIMRMTGATTLAAVGAVNPAIASLDVTGDPSDPSYHRYEVVFGRDSLFVASMLRKQFPALQLTTFKYLAARQGLAQGHAPEPEHYIARNEEEGRIPHEIRDPAYDTVAQAITKEVGWQWPFYRSDDATLLFARDVGVMALSDPKMLHECIIQRDGTERELGYALGLAAQWILGKLNNNEGLLYSERPKKLRPDDKSLAAYPIWMDSGDAAAREDGTLTTGNIAWIECQGYTYDALLHLAAITKGITSSQRTEWKFQTPDIYAAAALHLQQSVLDHYFYMENGTEHVGFGIEQCNGVPKTLHVLKSNVGHLLSSSLLDGKEGKVKTIAQSLLDPHFGLMTPNGIRSLSSLHPRFRPGAYHMGSIWLFDNHIIANGLRSHGYRSCANWIDDRIQSMCHTLNKYPEYIRGEMSTMPQENTAVVHILSQDPHFGNFDNCTQQPGQTVQAWSLAAFADIAFEKKLQRHGPTPILTTSLPDMQLLQGIQSLSAKLKSGKNISL